jgi:hypothetical protein
VKRFITNDDLTLLAKRAAALRKLTKAAQKIHADLAVEEGYMKAAEQSMGRCHRRLHNGNLSPKKRSRLEQQLERHQLAHSENCSERDAEDDLDDFP